MGENMNLFNIKEISPRDILMYKSIWDIDGKEARLQNDMISGNRKMFIANLGDVPIGGMSIVFESNDTYKTIKNKRAYLSYLVIISKYQNQGYGSLLIDFAVEYANDLGFSEISISVENCNIHAKRLYIRKGFKCVLLENDKNTILLLTI